MDDLYPSLEELNRLCQSISGGMVCYSGDSVGAVAVYSCNDSHLLQGDSTRECLPTGYWSGTTPQCIPDTESNTTLYNNQYCCKDLIFTIILHVLFQVVAAVKLPVKLQLLLLEWCAVSYSSLLEFYWEQCVSTSF